MPAGVVGVSTSCPQEWRPEAKEPGCCLLWEARITLPENIALLLHPHVDVPISLVVT